MFAMKDGYLMSGLLLNIGQSILWFDALAFSNIASISHEGAVWDNGNLILNEITFNNGDVIPALKLAVNEYYSIDLRPAASGQDTYEKFTFRSTADTYYEP